MSAEKRKFSACDVEEMFLDVMASVAIRMQSDIDETDKLHPNDLRNLPHLQRAATEAARAEIERLKHVDAEKLSDDMLAKVLAAAGVEDDGKSRRRRV